TACNGSPCTCSDSLPNVPRKSPAWFFATSMANRTSLSGACIDPSQCPDGSAGVWARTDAAAERRPAISAIRYGTSDARKQGSIGILLSEVTLREVPGGGEAQRSGKDSGDDEPSPRKFAGAEIRLSAHHREDSDVERASDRLVDNGQRDGGEDGDQERPPAIREDGGHQQCQTEEHRAGDEQAHTVNDSVSDGVMLSDGRREHAEQQTRGERGGQPLGQACR